MTGNIWIKFLRFTDSSKKWLHDNRDAIETFAFFIMLISFTLIISVVFLLRDWNKLNNLVRYGLLLSLGWLIVTDTVILSVESTKPKKVTALVNCCAVILIADIGVLFFGIRMAFVTKEFISMCAYLTLVLFATMSIPIAFCGFIDYLDQLKKDYAKD